MKKLIDFSSRFRILKGGKISLVVSALLGTTTLTFAAPSGGVVTSGAANITQNGNITNINQASQKASINWQNFSINQNETVNFIQPNVNSITLNRVVGNETSIINGALNANGQVWILNSNGVLFGKNASVNTSGLLATTAKLSDENFQNGNYSFKDAGSASIINQGTIEIANSGSVIFASNEVINEGSIKAIKGKVHLTGASNYTVNLNDNSLVNLKVDKGVLDAMVENSGTIIADGGEVYLTTNAVDELLKGVVNNTGIIEANSLDGLTGKIELFAHGGSSKIDGTLEAQEGFIETSAKSLGVKSTAKIKAETWLIDPVNIEITSSGEDNLYGETINASAIETALENGNVQLQAEEDITVNQDITWEEANTLTLNAGRDIAINSQITATNNQGKVELLYGQSVVASSNTYNYSFNLSEDGFKGSINLKKGENFKTKLGSDGSLETWYVITSLGSQGYNTDNSPVTGLQSIPLNSTSNYVLGTNIDASETKNWSSAYGDGFLSLNFSGKFDGLGHTVDKIYINSRSTYKALFGYTDGATIRNLGVTNVDITAASEVGAIVGRGTNTIIENTYSSGKLTATGNGGVGGLVGYADDNFLIKGSHSSAEASGAGDIAGLAGSLHTGGIIEDSYATGDIKVESYRGGGLVGLMRDGAIIRNSYASGNIIATGENTTLIGGIAGAAGSIGSTDVGGVYDSYFIGTIQGGVEDIGGVYGRNSAEQYFPTNNTFYDKDKNPGLYDRYRYGYTTSQISALGIYGTEVNFSLSDILTGYTYNGTETLLSTLWSTSSIFEATYSDWVLGTDYNFMYNGNIVTGFTNAGNYSNISINILKTGFVEASTGNILGNFVIIPKDITSIIGITAQDKTYDSETNATLNTDSVTFNGMINNDELIISDATANFSDKNVGENKTVNISNIILGGEDALNYNLVDTTATTTATINKKDVTVNYIANDKTYNANTIAIVESSSNDLFSKDDVTISEDANFSDKNAGENKAVTITNIALSGDDATNYNLLTTSDTSTANIDKKDVTVTYTADNKTYDGTTSATVYELTNDLIDIDNVTISEDANFSDKNAEENKTVSITNIALSGDDATNYNLVKNTDTTTADINKKAATVTADSNTVTYDGEIHSINTYTVTGLVENEDKSVLDSVEIEGSGTNANTYTITANGYDNNYELSMVNGQLTINPKEITPINDLEDISVTVGEKIELPEVVLTDNKVTPIIRIYDKSNNDVTQDAQEGKLQAGSYTYRISTDNPNYSLADLDAKVDVRTGIDIATLTKVPNIITPNIVPTPTTPNNSNVVASPKQGQELKRLPINTNLNAPVHINQNSIVQLVKGGVKLPLGLNQEYYTFGNIEN